MLSRNLCQPQHWLVVRMTLTTIFTRSPMCTGLFLIYSRSWSTTKSRFCVGKTSIDSQIVSHPFNENIASFSFSDVYRANNLVQNFEELLHNIFSPLFEVSINPASHPKLHRFLRQVSFNEKILHHSVPKTVRYSQNGEKSNDILQSPLKAYLCTIF